MRLTLAIFAASILAPALARPVARGGNDGQSTGAQGGPPQPTGNPPPQAPYQTTGPSRIDILRNLASKSHTSGTGGHAQPARSPSSSSPQNSPDQTTDAQSRAESPGQRVGGGGAHTPAPARKTTNPFQRLIDDNESLRSGTHTNAQNKWNGPVNESFVLGDSVKAHQDTNTIFMEGSRKDIPHLVSLQSQLRWNRSRSPSFPETSTRRYVRGNDYNFKDTSTTIYLSPPQGGGNPGQTDSRSFSGQQRGRSRKTNISSTTTSGQSGRTDSSPTSSQFSDIPWRRESMPAARSTSRRSNTMSNSDFESGSESDQEHRPPPSNSPYARRRSSIIDDDYVFDSGSEHGWDRSPTDSPPPSHPSTSRRSSSMNTETARSDSTYGSERSQTSSASRSTNSRSSTTNTDRTSHDPVFPWNRQFPTYPPQQNNRRPFSNSGRSVVINGGNFSQIGGGVYVTNIDSSGRETYAHRPPGGTRYR